MKTTDSANNFINTLFCTYNYFKVWDRIQLNLIGYLVINTAMISYS